jgi:chemotaxis protein CheD
VNPVTAAVNLVTVGIAEIRLGESPDRLVTYGLGSCVAIVLYHARSGTAAMAHVMLPMAFECDESVNPAKYADTAVMQMVHMMGRRGIAPGSLAAKMAGGADMFAGLARGKSRQIGERNVLTARKTLRNGGIVLEAEDTGGNLGRSVEFDTSTGRMTVRTLRKDVKVL